jgi:hypothetical protein
MHLPTYLLDYVVHDISQITVDTSFGSILGMSVKHVNSLPCVTLRNRYLSTVLYGRAHLSSQAFPILKREML